jgi:archaemetzincin
LVQIGTMLDYPLDPLIDPICERFPQLYVRVCQTIANAPEAYDSRRNQYHSTRIITLLESHLREMQLDKLLGVASFDLYEPRMKFVFGEARSPGRVGVISTYRLKPKSRNETDLLRSRVVKEAVHEIGHMMDLKHCSRETCVMHFSETLKDTDDKSYDFCITCKSRLKVNV